MRRGKTKVGERVMVSIGKRNTFDAHLHGVSLPWPLLHLYSYVKYKQFLGCLEKRREEKRRGEKRREEKVHNVTNNNNCIALKEIKILYVVMMKWIHKNMMEWCSCQVRDCCIPWKHSLVLNVPKSNIHPNVFHSFQCHCFSEWTKCCGGPLRGCDALALCYTVLVLFQEKVGHNLA